MNLENIKEFINKINRIKSKGYVEIQNPKNNRQLTFNRMVRLVDNCHARIEELNAKGVKVQENMQLIREGLNPNGHEQIYKIDDPFEQLDMFK